MPGSLPAGPSPARDGRRAWTRWRRHAVVIWLLIVEPARVALLLAATVPRLGTLRIGGWLVATASLALIAAGVAIARRLLDGIDGAWRAFAAWAVAAALVTIATHAAPLVTTRAPSEARVADAIAVAAYLGLAALAWRAERSSGDAARESS
jgi:hypothetical protein